MLLEEPSENYSTGWICLYRSFLKWEWYSDIQMVHLFLYILLKTNHKDKKWEGILIKRGQFVTGLKQMSKETTISIQSLRTRLKKLESTGEITIKKTNKYSIITVVEYESYQSPNTQTNNQLTFNQHSTNNQLTTTNNVNNYNNENKKSEKYDLKTFLEDWNTIRAKELKTPSNLNFLSSLEKPDFNDLSKAYSRDDFQKALKGLFKQKVFPNGNTSMQSNPKHFLTHFNSYLSAFNDKNDSLYGKQKIEV